MRRWNKKEIEMLKNKKIIMKRINRTNLSIETKANNLSIKKPIWTKKEVIFLKKKYPKETPNVLERELKRKFDTISRKANRLKIKRIVDNFNHKNGKWKGNMVGRIALHDWVRRRKIKPKLCERCEKDKSRDLYKKYK
jgi:hypothetical protein